LRRHSGRGRDDTPAVMNRTRPGAFGHGDPRSPRPPLIRRVPRSNARTTDGGPSPSPHPQRPVRPSTRGDLHAFPGPHRFGPRRLRRRFRLGRRLQDSEERRTRRRCRAKSHALARRRRRGHEEGAFGAFGRGRPGPSRRALLRRRGRHRSRQRSPGRRRRLHRGLRARSRRVGFFADQSSAAGRAGPAHPAAARWVPVPRRGPVRGFLRRRRRRRHGRLHGCLPGPLGVEALAGAVTEPAWKPSRAGIWWPPTTR
jgi:hypothetical protein